MRPYAASMAATPENTPPDGRGSDIRHPLRYVFNSCNALQRLDLRGIWLTFRKIWPDVLPVVGAQVAQLQFRRLSVQLACQGRACNAAALEDLIDVLLLDIKPLCDFTATPNRQHGERHAAKSSTQLDLIKPRARLLF